MPKLILHREKTIFGRGRNFYVILDGKDLGQIKPNETREFELPAGNHTLQIKLDWFKTGTKEFGLTDTLKLNIGMNKFYTLNIFLLLFGVAVQNTSFINLEAKTRDILFTCIFGAALIIIIYFFTIGRKYLITLKESDWMS